MARGEKITLEQVLARRDMRRRRQLSLLSTCPGRVPVVLTLNIPGAEKRNDTTRRLGEIGLEVVSKAFGANASALERCDLATGYEAWWLSDLSAEETKRVCCHVEDNHPLGRLFDIDVIGADAIPISRSRIGLEGRKCLLCEAPAHECARSRRHTPEDIVKRIVQMVEDYEKR